MQQLFDNFLGNAPWRWLVAGAVAFGIFFVLLLLRRLARKQYAHLEATPQEEFLELPLHVASRTAVLFLLITSIFLGLQTLELPARAARTAITLLPSWASGSSAVGRRLRWSPRWSASDASRWRRIAPPPARSASSASSCASRSGRSCCC